MEYKEIITAIKSSRDLGLTDEQIRQNLVNAKFADEEINKAFIFLPREAEPVSIVEPTAQVATLPVEQTDVQSHVSQIASSSATEPQSFAKLMQMFEFISIYMLTASICGILCFNINRLLPNATYPYFKGITDFINQWQIEILRAEASVLAVSLIIFTITMIWNSLHRQEVFNVLNSFSVKFFLLLTIMLYSMAITGYITFLLFNIFSQTLSLNFIAHLFVAFTISSIILYYCSTLIKQTD